MNPDTPAQSRINPWVVAAGALLVAAIIFIGVLMDLGIPLSQLSGYFGIGAPAYTSSNDPYTHLMRQSATFAQADTARLAGNATTSIALYYKAIGETDEQVLQDQIRYKIALAESDRHNYLEAIKIYTAIANNQNATNIMRAYSVQSVTRLWIQEGDGVATTVFATQPFASLYSKDRDLTRRDMFKYATELYPLAISELYTADWYATRLEKSFAKKEPTLAPETKDSYIQEVRSRIALAEKNLEKIKDDPNTANQVPVALSLRASLERSLAVIGASTPEEADRQFKRAFAVYALKPGKPEDGILRFQYARFLNEVYGADRIDDIRTTLAPMYQTSAYEGSDAFDYFSKEKDDLHGKKRHLAALARRDSKFKVLLIKLGWKESDFVSTDPR